MEASKLPKREIVVPKVAVDYLKNKNQTKSFSYKDVWAEQHYNAFTVAKSTGFDVLGDIQSGLIKAIEEGKTLKQFTKELKPLLEAKGWVGKKRMLDPLTGKMKNFTINIPRRLEKIFNVNISQARMRQFVTSVMDDESVEYLMYVIGPAKNHREDHLKLDGLVLRKSDTRWQTIIPPNGYNCRCDVIPVDESRFEELKLEGIPNLQDLDEEGFAKSYKPIQTKLPELNWNVFFNDRQNMLVPKVDDIDAGFEFPSAFYGNGLVLGQNMSLKAGKIRQMAKSVLAKHNLSTKELEVAIDKVMRKTSEGEILGVYWQNIVESVINDKNKKIENNVINMGYMSLSRMNNLKRLSLIDYDNATIALPTNIILKSGDSGKDIKHDPSNLDGMSISQLYNLPKILQSADIYFDKKSKNLMLRHKVTKDGKKLNMIIAIKLRGKVFGGFEVTSIYNARTEFNKERYIKINDKTKKEDLSNN